MPLDFWRSWPGPKTRKHRAKHSILIVVLVLLALGATVQLIVSPALAQVSANQLPPSYFFNRHLIAIFVGLLALFIGFKVKLTTWMRFGPWLMMIGLALALLTVILGGLSSRWLPIGPLSLQAVEIVKIGFILTSAGYLHHIQHSSTKSSPWTTLRPLVFILGIITFIIAMLQADFGSAFVIFVVLAVMVWLTDIPIRSFVILLTLIGLIASMLVLSTPYRRDRVVTLFNPTADCQDSGYQVCQALIGVGSGGLLGRGIGKSVQVHGYLPEAKNDSIFAIYAESRGFLGSAVLILLFYLLFRGIYSIAIRSEYALMLIATGVLAWFSTQAIINIGAMLGLVPLKGITLPFLSYGGSSLVLVLFAMGIVIQISSYTTDQPNRVLPKSSASTRGKSLDNKSKTLGSSG